MLNILCRAASAVHHKLVRSSRILLAAAGLVILSGAFDACPLVSTAHAANIASPTASEMDQSQGTDGDNVIKTANKFVKFYFIALGIAFVCCLAWAGWKTTQDKDIAPVKWTLIGGLIFACAGGLGKMIIGWMA